MSEGARTRPSSPNSMAPSIQPPAPSSLPQTPLNASSTSLNVAGETAIPIDLPDHAHDQGHQTLEITLPTANGDGEHFELQPVGKHEKVRGTVVKDRKVSWQSRVEKRRGEC